LYQATHQFKEAAGYYDKALQVDPKNVPIRTQLASCLYYQGDVDGAISQLAAGAAIRSQGCQLPVQPRHDQVQGKKDTKGALALGSCC
jgi:thioredoxin-like negative regulator of GroEL